MKRSLKLLSVATVTAMLGVLFVAAPAHAVTTCTFDGVDTINLAIDTDDAAALRVEDGTADFEFVVNPGADLSTAPWANCGAANGDVQFINVTGADNGQESFTWVTDCVDAAAPAATDCFSGIPFSILLTFVDLGAGNDTVNIAVYNTAGGSEDLNFELGQTAGGVLVGDLDDDDIADLEMLDTEIFVGTGSLSSDDADLQGEFAEGMVTGTTGGVIRTIAETRNFGAETPPAFGDGNFPAPFTFNAAQGDDNFDSGLGNDTYNGGPGDDEVDYDECPAAVTVDLQAGTATGGCGSDTLNDVQEINDGSVFDDTLLGSSIDNEIDGDDGDDFIDGRAGNDDLDGQGGDDTLFEGAAASGADLLVGGADFDTLDYSQRTDAVHIDTGGAAVSGSGGCPLATTCEDDSVAGDFELFLTGGGNDSLIGDAGVDIFRAGAGNDSFDGNGGTDTFDFSLSAAGVTVNVPAGTAVGDGNDTFTSEVEQFNGSAQADTFIDQNDPTAANDSNAYIGNGGDDIFDQGASLATGASVSDSDDLIGGSGTDFVDYGDRTLDLSVDMNNEVTITLPELTIGGCVTFSGEASESDCISDDVENLLLGSGDDSAIGNDRNNLITGALGNDSMAGGDGNDSFPQGSAPDGSDSIFGDLGADTVDYSQRTGNVRATLGGGGNQGEAGEGDTLSGLENAVTGSGSDLLIGNSADNILTAGAGDDLVNGQFGQDQLDGGAGRDRVSYETGTAVVIDLAAGTGAEQQVGAGGFDTLAGFEEAIGTPGTDVIRGDGGDNVLRGIGGKDIVAGRGGNDRVNGGTGGDTVNGGAGDDAAKGGPGNDTVRGGPGADRVNGGTGRDRCSGGSGSDTITNCER